MTYFYHSLVKAMPVNASRGGEQRIKSRATAMIKSLLSWIAVGLIIAASTDVNAGVKAEVKADDYPVRQAQSFEQQNGSAKIQQNSQSTGGDSAHKPVLTLPDNRSSQSQLAMTDQYRGKTENALRQQQVPSYSHRQMFSIYDASTHLLRDDDFDGYYQEFSVVFDVDVDHGDAVVFAELYLSVDGEYWEHFYSTDAFYIVGQDASDEYQVITTLLSGYRSADYDVLIDIYDHTTNELVVTYSSYDDAELWALPLESASHDRHYAYDEPVSSYSSGHSGNISLASLLSLIIVVVARAGAARIK